jgi:hypothetical protein
MFLKSWKLGLAALFLCGPIQPLVSLEKLPACFQDLETNFFKYEITVQAFSMHRIGQSQWSFLVQALQTASQAVPGLVNAQAKLTDPNPLQNPVDVKATTQLLRWALFSVFRQVMIQSNMLEITNEASFGEMFQYIWFNQHHRIVSCLGEEAVTSDRVTE